MKIIHGTSAVSLQSTRHLCDEMRLRGHKSDIVIYFDHPFFNELADFNMGFKRKAFLKYPIYLFKAIKFMMFSIKEYDIFHFHFGRTFLPLNLDLYYLKFKGKKIIMEYHGSEIRRLEVQKKINLYVPINYLLGLMENNSYKLQNRIAKFVDCILIHDQELRENLFHFNVRVEILPLRFKIPNHDDCYYYNSESVRILHAPSVKESKGTRFVIEAIEEIKQSYTIEFILAENMPYNELMKLISQSDIIIDQLLCGSYGMFTIESMASSKPTITYLIEELFDENSRPPIVNANIHNLKEKLITLISDAEYRHLLGEKGLRFVNYFHDVSKLTQKMIEIYNDL